MAGITRAELLDDIDAKRRSIEAMTVAGDRLVDLLKHYFTITKEEFHEAFTAWQNAAH